MSNSRKSNGDGSLRQRPDGRWEGRYTGPDGRQHSVYGKTKTACREAMKRKQAEVLTGSWMEPARLTVVQWLQTWLDNYCQHLKPASLRNYRCYTKTYFTPAFGSLQLSKLKPAHCQALLNDLGKRLSANSLKSIRIVLSSALSCAVRFELIQTNPCEKVVLSRPTRRPMTIVDRQQFPAFIAAAGETRCCNALLLLLQTGMRSGELRGLRWSDVDFEAQTITIARQLTFDGKKYLIQTPKSGKSRTIVMTPSTVELLRRHKIAQAEQRLAAGGWADDELSADLVFRKANGQHYSRTTLIGPAAAVWAAIGLPDLHPHDLRHSYAVAALRSGIDVKTVQNNLGHASAAMTLDTYAAYTDDMGRAAATKFEAYWRQSIDN